MFTCIRSVSTQSSSSLAAMLRPAGKLTSSLAVLRRPLRSFPKARSLSDGSPSRPVIRIYTKTGDRGSSSLYTGERRPKDDLVFEALGSVDELSCHIGFASELISSEHAVLLNQLREVQEVLQELGSHVATPQSCTATQRLDQTAFNPDVVPRLESWIDEYQNKLPPLKNFILPSGGQAASALHIARSVCRRAERRLVPLLDKKEINPDSFKFVNRLSDFLFISARWVAHKQGCAEVIYRPNRSTGDR